MLPSPPTGSSEKLPVDGSNATRLNPNFTFSTFVVGNSSRFAHAACRAVADAPGKAYNPLFLYGGVGLGKTHLMHAIGHAVREGHRRPPKVAYITSEKFMNEMIGSIQANRTSDFRTRYRSVDVLLIDDIQFLAGKDRTQEEFFHTFNALHEIQKQIVVSSDRPPKDIPTLEDRLRSRFEGGLMADIQPPDFETRLAILNTKLGPHSSLVQEDVCSFIAHKIQRNIRELEGALIRVLAHASINGQPVTLEAAQIILRDIIPVGDSTPVSIELIQETVAGVLQHLGRGDEGQAARQAHRLPAPGGHVHRSRGDGVVAAGDRQRLRRARPHHRAARHREDHRPRSRGRAAAGGPPPDPPAPPRALMDARETPVDMSRSTCACRRRRAALWTQR